jgi:integrase
MVKYTFKIIPRLDYLHKDGTCALMIQCFLGGHRVRINLDLFVRPEEYDPIRMQVNIPKDKEKAARINAVLSKYKSRVEEIFFEARMNGEAISPTLFKEELDNRPALASFIEFMESESEKEKIDKAGSTIKTYGTVIGWLKKFKPNTTFSDINFEYVQDFDRFLRKGGIDANSRSKYHKVLRKFVLLAQRKRRRLKNPYEQFKIKDVRVERVWLSVEEVEKLVNLYKSRILGEKLHRTLRHFLFQIVTSVRVSDLKRLEKSDREGDMLVFRPEKTKSLRKIVKIPLSDLAKQLIADSESKSEMLFEVPIEQVMNRRLKEIAPIAKIEKDITTHVGRHTFGFLYLLMGGKLEELREILGHSKIETTMVYTHTDYSRKVAGVKKFDEIFKVSEEE